PVTEAVLVVRRAELVRAEQAEVVAWPSQFAVPARGWHEDFTGAPVVADNSGGHWRLDPITADWTSIEPAERPTLALPTVFWSLSSASWVFLRPADVASGGTEFAREVLANAARYRGFHGRTGDSLLVPGAAGVEVLTIDWPYRTPALPTCSAAVPETCLSSGRQIAAELSALPGALDEATRQLNLACSSGIHRGCYEVVGLQEPAKAADVATCVNGDLGACNRIGAERLDRDPSAPEPLVIGLLEYSCALEGSGTLGQRLRRLEDVGAGCMMLVSAYDALKMPDQALLNLDQACVLGRSDACDRATERRELAFAARTVRECEDEALPNAASCVDLGKLLQTKPVAAAKLDDFGAFLRGCTLGAAEGCLLLGDYVDRWGIEHPRVVEAENLLLTSCNAGEMRACLGAGDLLVRHEPRTDAYGQALLLFDRACDAGLGAACVDGATQRRIGDARKVEAPPQQEMWTAACSLHSAPGCAGLGERMSRDKDLWPDAYTAWTKACDLGSPTSCSNLGELVRNKHEPLFDGEQPFDSYLRRGCDNGDPEGCFLLAEDALPKAGQPDEPTYLLLERSCEGEFGPGCAELATVHLGRETNFDEEIAARHFDTACENGHYESCKSLGLMYLKGKGVERDRAKANELLDRFRLNARPKYLRVGLQAGLPSVVGAEGELILPIPFGPAIGVSGGYSYVPGGGGVLLLAKGADQVTPAPDLTVMGATVRVFPNHQARGVYVAAGIHQLTPSGSGVDAAKYQRMGYSGKFGMRNDAKLLYSGVEFGMGVFEAVDPYDFDPDADHAAIPLLLPTVALSFGLAPF
ncbi:MAG: tetratricopeptide repeat protein, partial [Myxococcota bacterium]